MKIIYGLIFGLISSMVINIIILLFLPNKKIVCRDGWESPSIGTIGACSHHGGVDDSRFVYASLFSFFIGFIIAVWYIWSKYKQDEKEYEAKEKEQKEKIEELKRNSPSCPKCNSYMVKRLAKKGRYFGKEFWGCSGYPMCKGVINIENTNGIN